MTRIRSTKRVASRVDAKGYTHETHQIELDGLPQIEVEVKVPKTTNRLRDPKKRARKVNALVTKTAKPVIDGMAADHAG